MLIERTNLQKKLEDLQKKETTQEALMDAVRKILDQEDNDTQFLKGLSDGDSEKVGQNDFNFDLLESGRIFHVSKIKRICVTYRLRFIETEFFKAPLPNEALNEIRRIENDHDIKLHGCKLVAPASYFRLENADDPMLFAPIGNNYYYLVHKWGNDMHPLRKLCMWPLRNLENLFIFSLIFSFLLSFGVRQLFFSKFQETSEFLVIFLYTFKAVVALVLIYGISLGKNFSSGNWNSKYYNA